MPDFILTGAELNGGIQQTLNFVNFVTQSSFMMYNSRDSYEIFSIYETFPATFMFLI